MLEAAEKNNMEYIGLRRGQEDELAEVKRRVLRLEGIIIRLQHDNSDLRAMIERLRHERNAE